MRSILIRGESLIILISCYFVSLLPFSFGVSFLVTFSSFHSQIFYSFFLFGQVIFVSLRPCNLRSCLDFLFPQTSFAIGGSYLLSNRITFANQDWPVSAH